MSSETQLDVSSGTAKAGGSEAAPSADSLRDLARLLRSLVGHAPMRAVQVAALTFAMIVSSSVSLVMLVPLLGVAGLDVGDGSLGTIAELVAGALNTVGLELTIPAVLSAYLAIVVASGLVSHAQSVRAASLRQGYVTALRMQVFEAITWVAWTGFVRRPSTDFMHVLTMELDRVSSAVSGLLSLVVKLVLAVVYVALAVYVSPAATLVVVALGGSLMLLARSKTRLGRARGEAVSDAYEAMYAVVGEHLAGLRIVKSHGAEAFQVASFQRRAQRTADAKVGLVRNQADLSLWLQSGSAAIMAGTFGVAVTVFELPLASILLLLFLFARLVPMLTGLQNSLQMLLNLLPAVDRVEKMQAWLDEHGEPVGAARTSQGDAPALTRSLRLEGVSFRYQGAESHEVLHGVDIEMLAGRTTAIVGPSGGGKSTVADLVVGLITPASGKVVVDDVALEGERVPAWRRRIGYVNQDTFLFHDTIRANLLFVKPDASEDEMREALRSASAGFVASLPDGLDTVVGDRGVRLSGGERQRIALARAILRRPALLVLDEATSALDPENERVIQEAIANMVGKQTLLVIAHRLASVREAHDIYVMEFGRVVESGGWDDLVSRPGGRFRELCRAQGLLER